MANHTITITCSKTAVGGGQYEYSTSWSSKTINAGDTVDFKAVGEGSSIVLSGFASNAWTDPANITIYIDGLAVRKTSLNVSSTVADSISANPSASGYPTKSRTITVNPTSDTVPDNFILPDVGGAERSTQYSSQYTVEGLSTSVTASVSSGGIFKVNTGSATSAAKTVSNGDLVTVYRTSSSSYSTSVHTDLTIGAGSSRFTISTIADLNGLPKIYYSGVMETVALDNFFCGDLLGTGTGNTNKLYRGGIFVPNITENNAIASSGTLNLNTFGTCASVFTLGAGQNKIAWDGDTDAGQITQVLTWEIPSEISVGYSPYQSMRTQFKHSVSVTAHGEYNTGQVTSSASSSWSTANTQAWVRATVPPHSEGHFLVTVTVYARPLQNTSLELSTTMTGRIEFWGV